MSATAPAAYGMSASARPAGAGACRSRHLTAAAAAAAPGGPRVRRAVRAAASVAAGAVSAPTRSLADEVRADFPLVVAAAEGADGGLPLVYLDNAATSQKPREVLDAMDSYYRGYNANVHRGVHSLAARATDAYEAAREKVGRFVNAGSAREIVWTRNASEGINLVAQSWGGANLRPGDEVILSVMEHHSNLVPWQLVAARTGAVLRFVGLSPSEGLDMEQLRSMMGPRTRMLALQHVSNVLGCINPVAEIAALAHQHHALLLLDACQSVPHMPVDVQALGCDFLVASGHKMCAPTGIGFLWGRPELLAAMPPWMGGGDMIDEVFLDKSTYAPPPARFEAGTPAIAEAIGMGAACDYLSRVGMDRVHAYEDRIGTYLYERLAAVPGVRIYGPKPAEGRAALAAFSVAGIHATDLSTILDASGVAIRSGHHCTQPLHRHLSIPLFASARASAYLYNTEAEVDTFVAALVESISFFKEAGGGGPA